MKKIVFFTVLLFLGFPRLPAQSLTLNFESGSMAADMLNCWDFPSGNIAYTSLEMYTLSGEYSGLTRQLNAPKEIYVQTPWMKVIAGNITFDVKVTGLNNNSKGFELYYIPYSESGTNHEGTMVKFYDRNFDASFLQLTHISVPVPSAIANDGQSYRIRIVFLGKGGSDRAVIDDFTVPGWYNSDPTRGCTPIPSSLNDQDGDGVEDADDDYPADPYRAYNNYFPSASLYGTLWFEDNWPSKGDYDFNDLVMGYRIHTITNAEGNVVEQEYHFKLRAIGAGYQNGFGFQIMHVPPASITRVTGHDVSTGYSFAPNGLETGQTHPTVIVFDNAYRLMGTPSSMVNTLPNFPFITPYTFTIKVTFIENGTIPSGGAVTLSQLNPARFNPFLVINGERGREVHLPNYPHTDKVSSLYFNTEDDASDSSSGRYYVTSNNLPWALNIPVETQYPIETVDISKGFLKFIDWVLSGGVEYPDWYTQLSGYLNSYYIYPNR